ncbi:MAG: lipopolysaccharide kinase InaA family protein [Gammaproteobacteria bacterium]|nr:lipopolysaccharide kinase InaA family protein [Gammaproteobacteria bacterium]
MTAGVRLRPGQAGELAPGLAGPGLDAFLDDPDACMDRGVVLKDDPSSRVVQLELDGRELVIKRFRHPDAWRALRRLPRPSRARGCWHGSRLLQAHGFDVPEPLGWLERRRGPLRLASWWLAARIQGREIPDVMAASTRPEQEALIDRLADLVAALQRAGIAHGDLKATNLLLADSGRIHLLDLHAVRRVRPGGRALQRDLRRFRRNWIRDPLLLDRLQARLDGSGLR